MKYQKDLEKFSFGFGSEKTAGKGSLKNSVDAPEDMRKRADRNIIITIVAQVAVGLIALFVKSKTGSKKDKKKAKKSKKKK